MRDHGRVKEHYDFTFDSRQLGLVLFAALVVAALVFVLGISVGRQWERRLSAKALVQSAVPQDANEAVPETVLPAAPPVAPAPDEKGAKGGNDAQPTKTVQAEEAVPEEIAPEKLTFPKVLSSGKTAAPPAPSKKTQVAKTAGKGKYTIQVAALKDRKAAEGLAGKLRNKGYDARVHSSGGSVYKVHVGGYSSRDDAQKVLEKLRSKEGLKPYVTTY